MKTVINRMKRKTPKFFRRLRTVGLTLSGIGAALLAIPAPIPQVKLVAGYLVATGMVIGTLSQTAVTHDAS